jgi:hypothetical protein
MTIETREVPDGVLDALLDAVPDKDPGAPWNREDWRQALAGALTAWEGSRPAVAATYAAGHECAWRTVGVQHRDALLGIKQTDILQRCDGCGEVRTPTLTGTWTLEQLRA